MITIEELEKWMLENNIKNTYTPNVRYVTDEGLGLEEVNGLYIWYHIERGERDNIMYFQHEKEAVQYVYNYLLDNEK